MVCPWHFAMPFRGASPTRPKYSTLVTDEHPPSEDFGGVSALLRLGVRRNETRLDLTRPFDWSPFFDFLGFVRVGGFRSTNSPCRVFLSDTGPFCLLSPIWVLICCARLYSFWWAPDGCPPQFGHFLSKFQAYSAHFDFIERDLLLLLGGIVFDALLLSL